MSSFALCSFAMNSDYTYDDAWKDAIIINNEQKLRNFEEWIRVETGITLHDTLTLKYSKEKGYNGVYAKNAVLISQYMSLVPREYMLCGRSLNENGLSLSMLIIYNLT